MVKVKQEVIWQPQPGPQTRLVTCPVFEVFFGGARGGGKLMRLLEIGSSIRISTEYMLSVYLFVVLLLSWLRL